MSYTIYPDAPGQPGCAFKVFNDGTKVATLTPEQIYAALKEHIAEGDEPLRAISEGTMEIMGRTVRTAVLNNGERVVVAEDAEPLLREVLEGEQPEIHQLMVLSTAHITAEVNKTLGDSQDHWQRVENLTEGWTRAFITPCDAGYYITLSRMNDDEDSTPQCIRDICDYASKHGCTVIRLDHDGPMMEDLTVYTW